MPAEPEAGTTVMRDFLRAVAEKLHLLVAVLAVWLVATSPWVSMLGKMPREPGFFNVAHVYGGLAASLLALAYLFDCVRDGAWKLNFPWASGEVRSVVEDLRGIFRGRVPAAESGGLFGALSGLTLVAFLATGITGAVWSWTEGTTAALEWRAAHLVSVRVFIVLGCLHIVAVALHLLDFVRD